VYSNSVASSSKISQPTEQKLYHYTDKKRKENPPPIQGNSIGAAAKPHTRKGLPTYKETQKYFPIYEEAAKHTRLRNRSIPNPPTLEENLISPPPQRERNKIDHF
jgi:hypothetical protein